MNYQDDSRRISDQYALLSQSEEFVVMLTPMTGHGSPVGVITPASIIARYIDLDTGDLWWATGLSNTDWLDLSAGGGGTPGAPIYRKFPFTYSNADLATALAVYTPTVGDLLLSAILEIDTAWNGTTPLFNIGAAIADPTSLLLGTAWDMTQASPSQTGFVLQTLLALGGGFGYPVKFTAADALCVIVNTTGGNPAEPASCATNISTPTPLVVTSSNNEFVYTPISTGIPETFTVASGTYATIAEIVTAVADAVGASHGEHFSTYVTVFNGITEIGMHSLTVGSAQNGDTISAGANDVAADLGYTETDTFTGGIDAGIDPGATQGAAILYLVTVTPVAD